MNTTAADQATPRSPRRPTRRGLRPPLRKAVLVAHVLSAGAWVGIDVLVAVLVLVGWFSRR